MPETPDFDQIARKILGPFEDPTDPLWRSSLQLAAEQLRQVWNARGAADAALLRKFIAYASREAGVSLIDGRGWPEIFDAAEWAALHTLAQETDA
jgi:hypothetical protein